jgi:hypothetical protein
VGESSWLNGADDYMYLLIPDIFVANTASTLGVSMRKFPQRNHMKNRLIALLCGCVFHSFLASSAQSQPGTLRWAYDVGTLITGSPALAEDGTVYVGGSGGLYAVTNNGFVASNKWTFSAGGALKGSATIGVDGTVYFATQSGMFYALFADGSTNWIYPFQGFGKSSPAIGLDNTIYLRQLVLLRACSRLHPAA